MESARKRMTEQEEVLKRISHEYAELKAAVEKIKATEVDLTEDIKLMQRTIKESSTRVDQHRKNLDTLRKKHVEEQQEFNAAVSEILKTKKPLQDAESDAGQVAEYQPEVETLPVLEPEQLEEMMRDGSKREELSGQINLLEEERDRMRGSVNMNALMEYLRKDASYRFLMIALDLLLTLINVLLQRSTERTRAYY